MKKLLEKPWAKALAFLLTLLPGTAAVYGGVELVYICVYNMHTDRRLDMLWAVTAVCAVAAVIEYSGECARLGIKVLPPDVNVSGGGFTADANGQIRFGLNAVKNVGRNLIEQVVEKRQGKPYTSLYDFCKRMYGNELNRRAVESLIKAGAFDHMGVNRHSLVEAVDGIIKSVESDNKRNLDGQLDLFSVMSGLNAAGSENADSYEIKVQRLQQVRIRLQMSWK